MNINKPNILFEIASRTLERVKDYKVEKSLEDIKSEVENKCNKKTDFIFEKAIQRNAVNCICEIKKASPSKGIIDPVFDYLKIAKEYNDGGADAISVLTEPFYFKGSDKYLIEVVENVKVPVLRKDFYVDEYMIYQAKIMGASAVLLICSILSDTQLEHYYGLANELGMTSIFEVHDEQEIERSIKCKARVIGINNRNLKNFSVDINNSMYLRSLIPDDILVIAESGIKTHNDIQILRKTNTNVFLIGETLMRSDNKKEEISRLKGLL